MEKARSYFATSLTELINETQISYETLAKLSEMSIDDIKKIQGCDKDITLDQADRIADSFHLNVHDFLFFGWLQDNCDGIDFDDIINDANTAGSITREDNLITKFYNVIDELITSGYDEYIDNIFPNIDKARLLNL